MYSFVLKKIQICMIKFSEIAILNYRQRVCA